MVPVFWCRTRTWLEDSAFRVFIANFFLSNTECFVLREGTRSPKKLANRSMCHNWYSFCSFIENGSAENGEGGKALPKTEKTVFGILNKVGNTRIQSFLDSHSVIKTSAYNKRFQSQNVPSWPYSYLLGRCCTVHIIPSSFIICLDYLPNSRWNK